MTAGTAARLRSAMLDVVRRGTATAAGRLLAGSAWSLGGKTGTLSCGPSRTDVTPELISLAMLTDSMMGETAPTDARVVQNHSLRRRKVGGGVANYRFYRPPAGAVLSLPAARAARPEERRAGQTR